jgi:hypothetical protein
MAKKQREITGHEIDLMRPGTDINAAMRDGLANSPARQRQGEKLGRIFGNRVSPATDADSDPVVEKARQEAVEARREADEAKASLTRRA